MVNAEVAARARRHEHIAAASCFVAAVPAVIAPASGFAFAAGAVGAAACMAAVLALFISRPPFARTLVGAAGAAFIAAAVMNMWLPKDQSGGSFALALLLGTGLPIAILAFANGHIGEAISERRYNWGLEARVRSTRSIDPATQRRQAAERTAPHQDVVSPPERPGTD